MGGKRAAPPRALFLGSGYAGHRSRFENLRTHVEDDPRLDSTWRMVTGWQREGQIERVPILPRSARGRLRALAETSSILRPPRPDIIWTAVGADLAPFAWSLAGPFQRPVVMDLDWTIEQRETLAPWYLGRASRRGVTAKMNHLRERVAWDRVTLFTPWSEWAADSLRRQGVSEERVRVLPPGVDLDRWNSPPRPPLEERRIRLLFVGGDFRRKGGELLLEFMRQPASEHFELDIVTRESVGDAPRTRVHQAEPNSAVLVDLYRRADLFVMPSLAECFGLATIEAMASGLPVLVSDRGASREIVNDDQTGFVIAPEPAALRNRLAAIQSNPVILRPMGAAGRRRAAERFDGRRNDSALTDILVTLANERPSAKGAPLVG